MEEEKPKPIGGLRPTLKPSVNGVNGARGMLAPRVTQPIDKIKISSEKDARCYKWNSKEDVTLMSVWCIASEDRTRSRKISLWEHVKNLYDEARAQSSEKLGPRNKNQMKGRWKRLNENANKWIAAYKEAYRHKKDGTSLKDVENEAYKIYASSGTKFTDFIVFNEVMCKHPQWELQIDRYEVSNEESSGSTKRIKIDKEVDDCVHSNPEISDSGGSTIQRPTFRYAFKKNGKDEILQSSWGLNDYDEELRAMRITRENEIKVMKHRLDLELKREERILKKEERELEKEERKTKDMYHMHHMHLNTLLAKKHLSLEDENLKRHLLAMLYKT